jgi:tetratricopeptide (TPR) repeat protein
MGARYLSIIGILLLILIAVISPIVYSGYNDLHSAQTALADKKYDDAARLFESAATHLVWRGDLWEQAGLAAYRGGNNAEAIRLLEIAREKKSLLSQGWETLGVAYWNNNEHKNALTVWQVGSQADPSDIVLYDRLSMAYHENGNYTSEQNVLVKRLALVPDANAHYQLGLLLMLSDSNRALTELASASSMDPQFDIAVQTLRAAIAVSDTESDPANRLIAIGRGLGLVEEWGLAENAFEKAVSADAKNAEAWAWLGEARQHNGGALSQSKGQDGSDDLNRALALNPHDAIVRALRGLYWKRQGNYRQALTEYLQAAQIEPDNPAWQSSVGDAYTQTGDLVSALAAYQKATQLAPNDATYWRLLAAFCSDNDLYVLDIGLPAAKQAAQLAPNDPQTLDVLGWSYSNAGLLYNSEQNLLHAIKLSPNLAIAHLHLAENYLRQGNNASALNELNLTVQLDKDGTSGQMAAGILKQYFP